MHLSQIATTLAKICYRVIRLKFKIERNVTGNGHHQSNIDEAKMCLKGTE